MRKLTRLVAGLAMTIGLVGSSLLDEEPNFFLRVWSPGTITGQQNGGGGGGRSCLVFVPAFFITLSLL